MNGQSLVLKSDWLTASSGVQSAPLPDITGNAVTSGNTLSCTYNHLIGNSGYWPNYVYYTTPAPRPIKLTMSEIDRLRKTAKADEKIKAILAKFTDQIEIVVDFE